MVKVQKLTLQELKIYRALLTAFQQVREGGTVIPELSIPDMKIMAQSIADSLKGA